VRLRKRSSPPLERLGQKHSFDTDDEESTSAVDDPTHSVTTTMAGDHYSDVVPLPEGIVSKLSSELSESSESSRHSYHKVQQHRHPREHRDDEDEDETDTVNNEQPTDGGDDDANNDLYKVVPPNDHLKDQLLGERIFERSGDDVVLEFENDAFDASEIDDEKV
jgi:hypothetical protein